MIAYLLGGIGWVGLGLAINVRCLTWVLAFGSDRGSLMSMSKIKTEHNGSKKGNGAFYGRKADAKKQSNSARRAEDKSAKRVENFVNSFGRSF